MNKKLVLTVLIGLLLCLAPTARAQTESSGLLIKCNVTDPATGELTTPCTIEHFLQQFVVIVQWGYSFVVFLAILMLVYGGIQWLTAAGRSSKIDEGKRVILGTIVGLIISFTAYIIVNFAVSAITGSTVRLNPFGQIATVFTKNKDSDSSLIRPFSGTDSGTPNSANCQNAWDRCLGLYCNDGGDGTIKNLQVQLNGLGCSCGDEDGCFGSATFSCVRRFQIANELLPTGDLDQQTQQKLAASPVACNSASVATRVSSISVLFPTAPVARPDGLYSLEVRGCCAFTDTAGHPLFCANEVSERSCRTVGGGTAAIFAKGEQCMVNELTRGICGMCYQPVEADADGDGSLERCFQMATSYYCENIVKPSTVFSPSVCFNSGLCQDFCRAALFISSDPLSGFN